MPQAQPQVTEDPSDMVIDICMCLLQTTFPITTTRPLCVAGVGPDVQPFHSSFAREKDNKTRIVTIDTKHHSFENTANGCQHSHHKANTHSYTILMTDQRPIKSSPFFTNGRICLTMVCPKTIFVLVVCLAIICAVQLHRHKPLRCA